MYYLEIATKLGKNCMGALTWEDDYDCTKRTCDIFCFDANESPGGAVKRNNPSKHETLN